VLINKTVFERKGSTKVDKDMLDIKQLTLKHTVNKV